MSLIRVLLAMFAIVMAGIVAGPAVAVEAVRVDTAAPAIDLTPAMERYHAESDLIQISTAPGPDGIVRRIAVKAREGGTRPDWIVFALTNDTDEQIERLLVAPHYRLIGSGVVWPDLGSARIVAITASQGIRPERVESADADAFNLTLDPGTTVTFVAELYTSNLPQLYLWEPEAYKTKTNGLTLYKGIIIGIAGLLALFMTVVFVVKGAIIFPAAAALAWAVLAYACIDFGFLQQLFPAAASTNRIYRAATEAVLAATLLVFLFAYLNLNRWYVRYSHFMFGWLVFLIVLVALAAFDAPVAAGVARISIATIAGIGFILVVHLASHGYDRAIMLIPTWFLLLVWVVAAAFTVMGELNGDLVAPTLIGGLVLIVLLIGFTVVQHAFTGGAIAQGLVSDTERKALAIAGSGDIVFDWDVSLDRVHVGEALETRLLMKRGTLEGPASTWLDSIHPFDRDRYRTTLDTVLDQRSGRIHLDFRLRAADGYYFWYHLRARPIVGSDGEVIRIVGILNDITNARSMEERLLYDAIHDTLTGLPNRELFKDRFNMARALAVEDAALRPTVILIDIDHFKDTNESVGQAGGDLILLTLSRRLNRLMRPYDTLARFDGDQWAVILLSEREPERIIAFADMIRRAISTPVSFAEQEMFMTASIGIALYDPQLPAGHEYVIKNADIAMLQARQQGGDRIEVFRPGMGTGQSTRFTLEEDLGRAIERRELKVLFRPIVNLEDRTIAGFDASLRWDHPRLGQLEAADFIPVAENSDLIYDIGLHALERTARELAAWQAALDVEPPVFVVFPIFSARLLRYELIQDVKRIMSATDVQPRSLNIGFRERLLMENPEYSTQLLVRLNDLGAGLVCEEYGAGHFVFSQMRRMPFNMIRLDRGLVDDLEDKSQPGALRAIITLAQDLGVDVIANGVESESSAVALTELGYRYGQGFAFGERMSAQEARRFLGVG